MKALTQEAQSQWLAGDLLEDARNELGNGYREWVAELAQAMGRSAMHLNQLADVSATFPDGYRGTPWSLYRAVRQAAKRMQEDVLVVLARAIATSATAADVATWAKDAPTKLRSTVTCETCGLKQSYVLQNASGFVSLPCPLCCAKANHPGKHEAVLA